MRAGPERRKGVGRPNSPGLRTKLGSEHNREALAARIDHRR